MVFPVCPICSWEEYDVLDAYNLDRKRYYRCLCDGCGNEFLYIEGPKKFEFRDPFTHEIWMWGRFPEEETLAKKPSTARKSAAKKTPAKKTSASKKVVRR